MKGRNKKMVNGFSELIYEEKKEDQFKLSPDATSLDLLRAVYRNPAIQLTTRIRCAIAALPFEQPKLAVTAVVSEQDFATLLDQRLKRMEEITIKRQSRQSAAKASGSTVY
jgi:hypothetical protein